MRGLLPALFLAAACAAPPSPAVPAGYAEGAGGALASSEPHASAAGAEILAAGGNAVDAAVATAFALAVTWPYAGNLGGGGFLVYRSPEGESWFLDFREVAPRAAHPDLYRRPGGGVDREASRRGWLAVAVPGSVPGLWEAHRRWGSLPWPRLLEPALRLAEEGFPLSALERRRLASVREDLLRDPLARRIFLPGGAPPPEGALLVQPELAATLRRIQAEGDRALRQGPVVRELVRAARAGGGILTEADFRDYQPVLRPVHRFVWRGLTLHAASLPSSGGLILEQVLRSLEGHPLETWGWASPWTVQLLGEAEARAFHDRNRWMADPEAMPFDPAALVDPAVLAERARLLRPDRYTPPEALGGAGHPQPVEGGDTTHFSVVDAAGGAASVTTTLNGLYGARVMAPGGFFLNNEMDDFAAAPGEPNSYGLIQSEWNAVRPGLRPLSSMTPLVVEAEGRAVAVLGSPGGATIPSSVLQVFLNRFLFGMDPREAVSVPRFHRQDRPPDLQLEKGRLDPEGLRFLDAIGQPWRVRGPIGDVNALFRVPGGWAAVSDPRNPEGSALALPAQSPSPRRRAAISR